MTDHPSYSSENTSRNGVFKLSGFDPTPINGPTRRGIVIEDGVVVNEVEWDHSVRPHAFRISAAPLREAAE